MERAARHTVAADRIAAAPSVETPLKRDRQALRGAKRSAELGSSSPRSAEPRSTGGVDTSRDSASSVRAVAPIGGPASKGSRPRVGTAAAGKAFRRGPRAGTRFGVLGAMLFVGATVVATSTPASAYYVDTPAHAAAKFAAASGARVTVSPAQGWRATSSASSTPTKVQLQAVDRDGYSVSVAPTLGTAGTGGTSGISVASAAVQWPFPTPVSISSGFGSRQVANCSFCSTNHQGLDFTPPAGTPIHVVAARGSSRGSTRARAPSATTCGSTTSSTARRSRPSTPT